MTQTSEQQPERKKQWREMECTVCGHRWRSHGYGVKISCPACYEAATGKKPGLSRERFLAEVLPHKPRNTRRKEDNPEAPDPRQVTIDDLTPPPPKPPKPVKPKQDPKPKPAPTPAAEPPKPSGGFLDRLLNSRIGGGS